MGFSIAKRWSAFSFAVVTAAVGCKSEKIVGTEGSIVLALAPTSTTIQQGGSTPVVATVTRSGSFAGTVTVSVTGAPTGVTGVVSNVQTSGTVTTATITITVDATTVPGTYNLTARASGTGVSEATAPFGLTVTELPAYTLTLSPSALSIPQSGNTPTTTVNLGRTNFTGPVTLSMENAPTGVTASFNPAPATGASSVMTLTVGIAVTPGLYNVTVRGVATGLTDRTAPLALTVTAAPASYTLSLEPAALSIAQGGNAPTTVGIARINFTEAVTLSLGGTPAGVTGTFNPAAPTGVVSTLTVAVGAAVAPGSYDLTVDGTGSAGNRSTPLRLTVTVAGNFTLTTTPGAATSVAQGSNTNVTVNVNRTGGNASDVALTVTGAPTGLTATLVPVSTAGNSSVLTLAAAAGLAVGDYPIVIHGNTTGLGEQLANLTVHVTAPSAGGNVTLDYSACPIATHPVWVAFQDGNGPWTQVTGTADVYHFNVTSGKGSYAWVVLGLAGPGTSQVQVENRTQAELTAAPFTSCATAAATKTVNGTVANLAGGSTAKIAFGGSSTAAPANGAFQVTNATDGPNDLVGYMRLPGTPGSGDRGFISRGLNPVNGGSVGTVDFTGANSFAPATATVNLTNTAGGEVMTQSMFYYSGTGANGCTQSPLYPLSNIAGTSFTAAGVPPASQLATDLHLIQVIAVAGSTAYRLVSEVFHDLGTWAASPLVLPSPLPSPTITVLGGPYKRLMAVVSAMPAELNSSSLMSYTDATVPGTTVILKASAGWQGSSTVTLALPDFTAVAGWLNTWAPGSSDVVQWTVIGIGSTAPVCQPGGRFATATRIGTS